MTDTDPYADSAGGKHEATTRQKIMVAFTEAVARNGYDSTSISEIARTVGISKGTVVHHFRDKQQMLEIGHVAYMKRRLTEAYEVVDALKSPAEHLTGIIICLLRAHRDDWAANVAFLREFTRFADSENRELRTLRAEYSGLVSGVLRRGTSSGQFRDDLDVGITSMQIFGMCNYAWTWYRPDGPERGFIDEVAANFAITLLRGIAGDPAHIGGFTLKWVSALLRRIEPLLKDPSSGFNQY